MPGVPPRSGSSAAAGKKKTDEGGEKRTKQQTIVVTSSSHSSKIGSQQQQHHQQKDVNGSVSNTATSRPHLSTSSTTGPLAKTSKSSNAGASLSSNAAPPHSKSAAAPVHIHHSTTHGHHDALSSRSPTSSASSASQSTQPPPTTREIFEQVAQARVAVVRRYHDSQHHHNDQIAPLLEAACRNAGVEPPLYLNIGHHHHQQVAGVQLLEVVQRQGLPLVFVNGDCVGGLAELRQLEKSGWLAEALRPHTYDLVVLGGGSGGLAAAKEAARLGKKVACLDFVRPTPIGTEWGLGGTCVNVGCIPKKLMHQAAIIGETMKDAKHFGWITPDQKSAQSSLADNRTPKTDVNIEQQLKPVFNWAKLKSSVQDHIASLNWNYRVQLREKKVSYFNSYGHFTGTHEVTAVNKRGKEEKLTANRFLLAVGVRPKYVEVEGAREFCITSDDLFSLPYPPGKTLCIGASYVSLECAGFLHGVGFEASVLVRSILLRGFDQDMAERIRAQMTDHGVRFLAGVPTRFERLREPNPAAGQPGLIRVHYRGRGPAKAAAAKADGEQVDASAGGGGGEMEMSVATGGEHKVDGEKKGVEEEEEEEEERDFTEEFNTVLLAIGREAKTEDLGLTDILQAQLSPKSQKLEGRREQSVNMPHLYGIGDVLEGTPELTPVAIQAGRVLMRRLYTGNMELTEYGEVPTTVFTPLEYGCCGITEEGARERYGDDNINVYHNRFTPLEYTLSERKDIKHCYCKLICLKSEDDKVLGFHYLGPNAGEVTQGFGIALKLGAKKADFDRLIGIHPTTAEVFTTLTALKVPGGEELEAGGC